MAVRVAVLIQTPAGSSLAITALLNGGFESADPHLLLPERCANALDPSWKASAPKVELGLAAGTADFFDWPGTLEVRIRVPDREGPAHVFKAYVSDGADEALVSDSGIDRLGVQIFSFAPGQWRFVDEARVRPTEAPQIWET